MNLKFVNSKDGFDTSHYGYYTPWDCLNDNLSSYKKDYFVTVGKNEKRHVLRLSYFGYNPINTLTDIVDQSQLHEILNASKYECPFNGYTHYSMVPIAILTSPETARSYIAEKNKDCSRMPYYTDMACDPEWNQPECIDDESEYMNDIIRTLLGSGYTEMCYPSDGSNGHEVIGINLENGDTVLFIVIGWFNK